MSPFKVVSAAVQKDRELGGDGFGRLIFTVFLGCRRSFPFYFGVPVSDLCCRFVWSSDDTTLDFRSLLRRLWACVLVAGGFEYIMERWDFLVCA